MSKLSKSSAELTLSTIHAELGEVLSAWSRTMANLDEAQPGFPSSTPGAAPGSGHSREEDPDEAHLLPVERMATEPDAARQAQKRVLQLVESMRIQAHELYSLSRTWGFDRQQGKLDLEENDTWCDSCLRLHRCEPRFRGRLCRWCYGFVQSENRHPSVELLDAHHRGVRVTAQMIAADHPARRVHRSRRRGAAWPPSASTAPPMRSQPTS